MIVNYSKTFKKQYKKLSLKQKRQFNDRVRLFIENPSGRMLRVHPLKGQLTTVLV